MDALLCLATEIPQNVAMNPDRDAGPGEHRSHEVLRWFHLFPSLSLIPLLLAEPNFRNLESILAFEIL